MGARIITLFLSGYSIWSSTFLWRLVEGDRGACVACFVVTARDGMWGGSADLHGDIAGTSTSGRGLAGAKVITYSFQVSIPEARDGDRAYESFPRKIGDKCAAENGRAWFGQDHRSNIGPRDP